MHINHHHTYCIVALASKKCQLQLYSINKHEQCVLVMPLKYLCRVYVTLQFTVCGNNRFKKGIFGISCCCWERRCCAGDLNLLIIIIVFHNERRWKDKCVWGKCSPFHVTCGFLSDNASNATRNWRHESYFFFLSLFAWITL